MALDWDGLGWSNPGSLYDADPSGSGKTPPAPQLSPNSGGSWFTNLITNAQKAFTAYENAQQVNDFNKSRIQSGLPPVSGQQYFSGQYSNGLGLGSIASFLPIFLILIVVIAIVAAVARK